MSVQTDLKIVEEWYRLHIEDKLSHVDIAKLYNVNRETVRRNFKRFNLQSFNYHNEIKHNKDKFSEIKTEEDAYWLGFIYADGYVSDKNDIDWLYKNSTIFLDRKYEKYKIAVLDRNV